MRIKVAIVAVLLLLLGTIFVWLRNEQTYQKNLAKGESVAMGLNARFMADPRFREVKALGYTERGTRLWSHGFFQVAGSVYSTNDWLNVRSLVLALDPPGRLDNKVTIKRPVQPVSPVVKNPTPTNKPASKVPARTTTRKK
ncbi:MAG: hypothetical protein JWQ71_4432 [Pedosphaera sp.]|nr:hypothetical protein [Pedosphaera sp.]